ncbi:ABC transporter [Thermus parvatiensis]|uniref:ABC transporter n=1 Tax=Thermus parvatiensis TaxID=456163 RepID=H7GG80_9DEIN|nr:ABC transporter [Thermus parvatiensis]
MGLVFQAYNLLPVLTALENAAFVLELRGVPRREREEKALAALAALGLKDKAHRYPRQLSGGGAATGGRGPGVGGRAPRGLGGRAHGQPGLPLGPRPGGTDEGPEPGARRHLPPRYPRSQATGACGPDRPHGGRPGGGGGEALAHAASFRGDRPPFGLGLGPRPGTGGLRPRPYPLRPPARGPGPGGGRGPVRPRPLRGASRLGGGGGGPPPGRGGRKLCLGARPLPPDAGGGKAFPLHLEPAWARPCAQGGVGRAPHLVRGGLAA